LASWPRSASARAATSTACSAVRSAALSFCASFRAARGESGVSGFCVMSGIVGMRLPVAAGGAMTERSEVAGGSITPPDRPSSREVTPPDRPSSREVTPGALSGEAVGGSVAMFWRLASVRTCSRQPSAAAMPGARMRARATIRAGRSRAGRSMCIIYQTACPAAGCALELQAKHPNIQCAKDRARIRFNRDVQMTKFRWLAIVAALIIAVPSLAPSPADARAGGGGGGGSRGSKSGQAPAPTQTAPTSKPVERSTTPQQQSPSANPAAASAAKPGGFMQRNPFMSGLMGGMLGAGLIGMMMGGGFGAGLGSMAGMLGFLLQLGLIAGIVYFGVRWWKSRNGTPAAAFAGAGAGAGNAGGNLLSPRPAAPDSMARTGLQPMMGGMLGGAGAGAGSASAPATQELTIGEADYNAFEALLVNVQAAYSVCDLAKLRSLVSPEMLGYFSEELSANASRGVENKVDAIKLEQGDLSEAWSEGSMEYATVAMRFSMIDVTRTVADGRIVEGNEQVRTEATEVWTFLRSRGGSWILSAIQQT